MQKYTYTAIVSHILAYEIMQSMQLEWKFYISISKFFEQWLHNESCLIF